MQPTRRIQPRSAVILTIAGLGLGAYTVQQVGISVLFTDRETAGMARTAAIPDAPLRAIVTSLATYPTLIGVGALLHLRRASEDRRLRAGYLALALTGIAMLAVVVNPISSARYTLGTVLFALAVMCGALTTRTRVRLSLTAIILGLFFVFPIADAFRRPEEVSLSRNGFLDEYLGNADYDAIWQISNALAYWSSGLAEVGRQALGLPLFWVPRSLWPGKPTDTGILLAEFRGYNVSNLSAPLWAEAVVNGGLVALVIVFVLLGFLLQRLDVRTVRGLGSSGWLLVGAVFPVYLLILLRGSMLQATGAVAVMIASILFVYRRPRAKPPAATTPP